MARLALVPDDDKVPDLSLLHRCSPQKTPQEGHSPTKTSQTTITDDHPPQYFQESELPGRTKMRKLGGFQPLKVFGGPTQASCNDSQAGRSQQRPLKIAHVNSLLLPLSQVALGASSSPVKLSTATIGKQDTRAIPRRRAKQKIDSSRYGYWANVKQIEILDEEDEDDDEEEDLTDLSGFIVSDSHESEDEDIGKRKKLDDKKQPEKKDGSKGRGRMGLDKTFKNLSSDDTEIVDLTHSPPKLDPRRESEETKENVGPRKANLSLDRDIFTLRPLPSLGLPPTKPASPSKLPENAVGFVTPPNSPSKPRLKSPSKTKIDRIPLSPHRPSIDAFWSQDVINEWNEQYSPTKTPPERGLHRFFLSDFEDNSGEDTSPTTSSRRPPVRPIKGGCPVKSPAKEDKKALVERKKAFDARKQSLAESFVKELDNTITGGRVNELSTSTGGICIVWSNKLNSTAGRATWKREVVRMKPWPSSQIQSKGSSSSSSSSSEPFIVRHYASIELATKVIDSEPRLLNTLAHEFCHLANFMISNVKNNPHGASFKQWASKVTSAFAHQGVEVTTKHSYEIAYKYAWACRVCGMDYQRHSRSIDTGRHRCGGCKGALVQIRPKPRKGDTKGKGEKASGLGTKGKGRKEEIKNRSDDGIGVIIGKIGEIELVDLIDE